MYRSDDEYERMKQLVIDIVEDYNINKLPINGFEICKKMKIDAVPYSEFEGFTELLLDVSKDGFCITNGNRRTIYYNDDLKIVKNKSRIQSTIFHEIKHILDNDKDDSEDDLADFFSKYFRCPLPLVIYFDLKTPSEIMSKFEVSYTQACIVIENKYRRTQYYGDTLFDNEKILVENFLKNKKS